MIRSWSKLLLGMVLLVSWPVATAQQPFPPVVDGAGNYHWTYADSNGARQEFTFVPATKIEPIVSVDFTAISEGRVGYRYTLGNGPSAAQKLRLCMLEVALPTAPVGTPPGWEPSREPNDIVPRVMWSTQWSNQDGRGGIPPGSEVSGFQLESSTLPGVVEFKCRGNAEDAPRPPDLPREIDDQVGGLLGMDQVVLFSLGPAIPRLDDPVPVLLRRVVRAYRRPLLASNAAQKAAIVRTLDEAIGPGLKDGRVLRETLLRATELLSNSPEDPWARDLTKGLSLSLAYVLQRLPPPQQQD